MSEVPGIPEKRESSPEVSTTVLLSPEGSTEYKIFPEHYRDLKDSILRILEQNHIEPQSVVLSGFNEARGSKQVVMDTEEIDAWRSELEASIAENRAHLKDLRERTPHAMITSQIEGIEQSIEEDERLLARPEAVLFYFSPVELLEEDYLNSNNPLNFAGKGGSVGVYVRTKIKAIDPGLKVREDGAWEVLATLAEVESAKVLSIIPRFKEDTRPSVE